MEQENGEEEILDKRLCQISIATFLHCSFINSWTSLFDVDVYPHLH